MRFKPSSGGVPLFSAFVLLAAGGLADAAPQALPQPVAPPSAFQERGSLEIQRAPSGLEAPRPLEERRRLEVRQRLAESAERLAPHVVRICIERRVADGVSWPIEASGLVVDSAGHVVTIGSTLEQAGRVAVYFNHAPAFRPRRALLLGIDDATDVGVLQIGPIAMEPLELLPAEAASFEVAGAVGGVAGSRGGEAMNREGMGVEWRYVVTLSGERDEESRGIAAGWLHEPVRNFAWDRRRFERLLQVTIARSANGSGGVVAQQDGRVVGLLLQAEQGDNGSAGGRPMLAIPAATLRRGFDAVVALSSESAEKPEAPASPPSNTAAKPWLGFGVRSLAEPEFLRQLGVAGALVVEDVFDESPALRAGLEPHDLVLSLDQAPLASVEDLLAQLSERAPGDVVDLECLRGLERRVVPITLAAW